MLIILSELAQAGLFTAAFAAIGWIFVYLNSRALARQSEVNTITASIEKMLQEVADENNKFWREDSIKEADHARPRLFNAFINFRCDFIEDKLQFLNEKCESRFIDMDHEKFEESIIDLIAQIRDSSTFNSESMERVDDKVAKVLEVNYLSVMLYTAIYDFLRTRYMSGSVFIKNYY
ncbi:hypothetical protein [Pseudomonas viridiflava]|uniref:hypothetical protein n=1 Tax=Pseudomonas syringae group TaxID=136849 RepID=UPI000F0274D9|nr:hypothetical protein [Pseudomonas viridiflava]